MEGSAAGIIRRVRAAAGLTQTELARRVGTRQSAISAYERGKREPSVSTLERIVAAAGSSLILDTVADDVAPAAVEPRVVGRLREQREAVLAAVAAHGGSNVRVFGSVARGEARRRSDLDLLIDLPERSGILTLGAIARDVARLVEVDVDVVPASALRPEFRDRIFAEAVPL
jgi:uncharacterized protein